jgi:coatomer subunit beta'
VSEDGTVKLWHSNTFRLENTLNYGLERAWALAYLKGSNMLAFGFDDGCVAIKLGREEPSISMDPSGKIIWTKHFEVLTANIKANDQDIKDGETLSLPVKELGNSEIYPQSLQHSPNGRFVVVCGDGEYIIYTALAWRNKAYGPALEFVWDNDSNMFALRESTSKVKICKNFKEHALIKTSFSAEQIYGGTLLGVRSGNFLCFYDWETSKLVRRIDVVCRNVVWSDNTVAITGDDSFYLLRFNRGVFQSYLDSGNDIPEDGLEDCFEFISDYAETVLTCCWVGNCFIFTNQFNRLCYVIGSEINTIAHFDK